MKLTLLLNRLLATPLLFWLSDVTKFLPAFVAVQVFTPVKIKNVLRKFRDNKKRVLYYRLIYCFQLFVEYFS